MVRCDPRLEYRGSPCQLVSMVRQLARAWAQLIVSDADVAGATVGVGEAVQATKINESATPKTILSRVVKECEVFVVMGRILLQKNKSQIPKNQNPKS